ncbi:TPA: hypothetical protein R1156_000975 [Yersinia enterocolitica]|nr:hypothetical protein [Yersinia enterocolitica]
MKALDRFTVERLEELGAGAMFFTGDEVAALARIALAAKRAEPNELADAVNEFLAVLDDYPEQLVPINREAALVKDLRKALSSTPQLNSPEIPEGWKLVPIEITKAMRDAWDSAPNGHEDDDVNMCNAYRAMIAAAPEPQTQQQNIPEIIPQGWTSSDPANAALVMLDRIDTIDSADDDRIEDIKLIIRQLAAAPESE